MTAQADDGLKLPTKFNFVWKRETKEVANVPFFPFSSERFVSKLRSQGNTACLVITVYCWLVVFGPFVSISNLPGFPHIASFSERSPFILDQTMASKSR